MFKPENVDAYIAAYPPEVQEKMQQLRSIIRKHAPYAAETLNYRSPAYKQDGIIFRNDLAPYKCAKNAVQLPLDRKLPLQLLTLIIKHRVVEVTHLRAKKRK